MCERHFFRFHQFIRGRARLFDLVNDLQNQFLRVIAFRWIDSRIDAEQSRIARSVGKCRDAESEALLFAHPSIQTRAASFTQNSGQ